MTVKTDPSSLTDMLNVAGNLSPYIPMITLTSTRGRNAHVVSHLYIRTGLSAYIKAQIKPAT